jgi:hypothetical protein
MPKKYECIGQVIVGAGGASTITFSSIPSTYTDLRIDLSLRRDNAYDRRVLQMVINSATSGYSDRNHYGDVLGGGVNITMYDVPAASGVANTFSSNTIYIPNYTSTNYKSVSIESFGDQYFAMAGGISNVTSAITTISFDTGQGGNWVQNSSAFLYGISKS